MDEARFAELEARMSYLEYLNSPQRARDSFDVLVTKNHEVANETDATDATTVPDAYTWARRFAFVDGKGWFAAWFANNATKIAPFKLMKQSMQWGCYGTVPVGAYVHGAVRTIPDEWNISKVVLNPKHPDACESC